MHEEAENSIMTGNLTSGEDLSNGIWPKSKTLWMAAFYMALFIIRPWEVLFPSLAALHLEKMFAIIMLIAIFLSGKMRFQITWQTVSILIFISAIIISGQFAYNPSLAWDSLFKYLTVFIFYLIMLMVIRSVYGLVFIISSYIFIMCLYLGKSQWEYFVSGRHRYTMGVPRLIGIEDTFGGPNALAMSIVVSLPFALLLWRNRHIISETWSAVWQSRFNGGLVIYGVLAITSIVLTNSRSGMIGFIVFCGVLMFGGKGFGKKIRYLCIGAIVLSFIWAFMPNESKSRFKTIWDPEEGPANAQASAEGRGEGFRAGMEMLRRRPINGVGVGNFVLYRVKEVDGIELEAHNLPGQLLGEMGLLGGVAFLMVLAAMIGNCRKVIKLATNQSDVVILFLRDVVKSCLFSILLLLLLGMAGHNVYRYNWLWIAAFGLLALQFVQVRLQLIEAKGYSI